jgi:uncharacterized protein (TIGR00266 family)
MQAEILGNHSFRFIGVSLAPGETIVTESGAMASMSTSVDLKAKLNGGILVGLLRKFLGGESMFINFFTNKGSSPAQLYLTAPTPGDIRKIFLNGETVLVEGGAYLCSTPSVKISLKFAGFRSLIAREGLFKIALSGQGEAWIAGYGTFFEKEINGEYLVDSGHLVSHPTEIKTKLILAGGLLTSLLSGEGFVMRLEGKGKVLLQSRSIPGLASWINPKL